MSERRRQGIINDFQDVQTQLYMERMLTPLKEWLNSVGIETRAQISYGFAFENSEPIMAVDYPEAENFNQYNQVDIFRLWTGGAKLENKVLSTETGRQLPNFGEAQLDLRDAYAAFSAGFQRIIWHIWGAGFGYGSFQWPGFVAGGFRYLGSRQPGSRDYDEFNAHIGRVQQILQTGRSRTDVGFIHQNWVQGIRFGGGIASDNTEMNWQLAHQGRLLPVDRAAGQRLHLRLLQPPVPLRRRRLLQRGDQDDREGGLQGRRPLPGLAGPRGRGADPGLGQEGPEGRHPGQRRSRTPYDDGGDDELRRS